MSRPYTCARQVVYLHANSVARLADLAPLSELKGLRKLTLHGNAVEAIPHYRSFVVLLVSRRVVESSASVVLSLRPCFLRVRVRPRAVSGLAHAGLFGGDGRGPSRRAVSKESL
jgi:hypothetical protein